MSNTVKLPYITLLEYFYQNLSNDKQTIKENENSISNDKLTLLSFVNKIKNKQQKKLLEIMQQYFKIRMLDDNQKNINKYLKENFQEFYDIIKPIFIRIKKDDIDINKYQRILESQPIKSLCSMLYKEKKININKLSNILYEQNNKLNQILSIQNNSNLFQGEKYILDQLLIENDLDIPLTANKEQAENIISELIENINRILNTKEQTVINEKISIRLQLLKEQLLTKSVNCDLKMVSEIYNLIRHIDNSSTLIKDNNNKKIL